jgi:hypothetical protein
LQPNVVFQQDDAHPHWAYIVWEFLDIHFCRHWGGHSMASMLNWYYELKFRPGVAIETIAQQILECIWEKLDIAWISYVPWKVWMLKLLKHSVVFIL